MPERHGITVAAGSYYKYVGRSIEILGIHGYANGLPSFEYLFSDESNEPFHYMVVNVIICNNALLLFACCKSFRLSLYLDKQVVYQ